MGLKEIICLSLIVACASAGDYNSYSCPTLFNFYPDSNDCTKFYRCVWGKPVRFSCGYGTRWNQYLLTCDHAYKVPCGNYPAGAQNYNTEPVYNNNEVYGQAHNVGNNNYLPEINNAHNVDPDYYQYVDNYRYGGEYPSSNGYGNNGNNGNHAYHKK